MRLPSLSSAHLLTMLREGQTLSARQQLLLTVLLSLPAMLAQLSHVVMEYVDASMVGHLGASASASVGLMATSAWMMWGLCSSCAAGFSVQVAHLVGARNFLGARAVVRQALVCTLFFSLLIGSVALALSSGLPHWLGAEDEICSDASAYFGILALGLPFSQMVMLCSGALRSSGQVVVPCLANVVMCALDVLFNFLLIFPQHTITLGSADLTIPGADMGVRGAALGTLLSEAITALFLLGYVAVRAQHLRLLSECGSFRPSMACVRRAVQIALPMGVQHLVMTGAQVASTTIVAPLGKMSIAANAFGITAESLCYMPGYGVADAAQTLVGQSLGAGRVRLMRNFAHVSVVLGMGIMSVMGVVMYVAAPFMMGLLSPVAEIQSLGIEALRIEAFAEPMFAASIVCYGVFVGAGDTLKPCLMNLGSIWLVRLSLAWLLAPHYGLAGVWTAMCVELCVRGIIFLVRLRWGNWTRGVAK